MKNIIKKSYILSFVIILLATSCSKDFEEINTNPTAVESIPPDYLLTTALLQGSGNEFVAQGAMLAYSACFIQHLASISFDWSGDKYFYNAFHSQAFFGDTYISSIKTLTALVEQLKTSGEQPNLLAVARIHRVLMFQRLTDIYGDIPYSEAGKAFIDGVFKPIYDSQEFIYFDMLNELMEAHEALDESRMDFGSADIVYWGDVGKWKKFAASMMLRLGMRLTKVAPSKAEEWVKKAITLGVMVDAGDNFVLFHQDGPEAINQNGIGLAFQKNDNARLSHTLVNQLDSLGDPRLNIFSWVESGGPHKGLPNGYDELKLSTYVGGSDLTTYSRVNPALIQPASPMFFQHSGEVHLLLAEAAVRGWYAGDATAHYEMGVSQSTEIWSWYDGSLWISPDDIATYLMANPLDISSEAIALERIHSEYWVATFLNPYESFANWRRTGLPELTPVIFNGSDSFGAIPRRLRYPQKEYSLNQESIQAAVERQGADLFTTRIWWDVE